MEKQAELNTLKAKFILFSSQLQIYLMWQKLPCIENEKEENSSPKMAANYSSLCVKMPNPRNNPAGNYTKLT